MNLEDDEEEDEDTDEITVGDGNKLKEAIFELEPGFLICRANHNSTIILGVLSQKPMATDLPVVLRKVNPFIDVLNPKLDDLMYKIDLQFTKLIELNSLPLAQ